MRNFMNIVESAQTEIVYHGSETSLATIRPSLEGIFFTPNRASAEAYARGRDGGETGELIAAHLDLRNPLVISSQWIEQLEADDAQAVEAAKSASGSSLSLSDGFEDSETWARELIFAHAHRLGHDSVFIPQDLLPEEDLDGDWGYFPSYAVFDPSCIQIIGRESVSSSAE